MTEKEKQNIENCVVDCVMAAPVTFTVNEEPFAIYPKTLGKTFLLNRLRAKLGINEENAKADPFAEALRLCQDGKDIILRMIVYMSMPTKQDVFNESYVKNRMEYFEKHLSNEELATLFLVILTDDELPAIEKHFRMDEERERKKKVAKVKQSNNAISFGGNSIWGTLIDFACERYGWTMDYVVWEISYTNLMMLYSDKTESIYLSDDEKKKLGHGFGFDGEVINADDPANAEIIKAILQD